MATHDPIAFQLSKNSILAIADEMAPPRVAPKPRRDDAIIKALVRAHRWQREIERGRAKSITDLTEQEDVRGRSSEAPGLSPKPERDLSVLVCPEGRNRRTQSGSSTTSQNAPKGASSCGPTAEFHQTTVGVIGRVLRELRSRASDTGLTPLPRLPTLDS